MRFLSLLYYLVLLLLSAPTFALEKDYQLPWCTSQGGIIEYRLSDGTRVDCLTQTHAVEVDFASKWAEAVGQSLHYANMTGKAPGILLIVDPTEGRFVERVKVLSQMTCPRITIWTVAK